MTGDRTTANCKRETRVAGVLQIGRVVQVVKLGSLDERARGQTPRPGTMDDNNTTNEPNESQSTGARPEEGFGTGARDGASEARRRAGEALPGIKAAASKAAYWTAYGISYAATYQWTLLQAGAREGVKAGRSAAEQWMEKMRQARTGDESRSMPQLTPSAGGCEPGMA